MKSIYWDSGPVFPRKQQRPVPDHTPKSSLLFTWHHSSALLTLNFLGTSPRLIAVCVRPFGPGTGQRHASPGPNGRRAGRNSGREV